MSQPPNYVVRQDSGGKLKLLLIRDPRATHVAKISPGAAVSLSQTNSTTSSQQQRATTSSTSHVTITAVPTKLRLPDRPGTASSASSSSFGASLSPTLLTHAANQAMGQAALVPSSSRARNTSTKVDGGGEGGGRVKGGKIVKLNNSKSPKKSPPTVKLHTSVLQSHSTSPHAPSGSSESPGVISGSVKTDHIQHMLPASRVRTIMRTDVHTSSTTNGISQDSVALVAKATELFIAQLARDAHMVAVSAAERDVHYCHLSTAVRKAKKTEFLHDILPGKVVVRDYLESLGNQTDHTHSNNCSADSSQ